MAQWQKVVVAEMELACGRSIFPPYVPLGNEWILTLECGHVVERPVRYTPDPNFRRGWFARRSEDDALPAPQRVKCEWCNFVQEGKGNNQ